jgi:hypothetical protein
MACQFIEEIVICPQQVGGSCQKNGGVSVGDVGHEGQEFVANPVSNVSRVGVGFVRHWLDAASPTDGLGVGAAKGKKWAGGSWSHG